MADLIVDGHSWDDWEPLDAGCDKRRAEVQRLIDTVRTRPQIPKRDVEQILSRVNRLIGDIKKTGLRGVDREDLMTRTRRLTAVLTLLRDQARTYRMPTGGEIQVLLDPALVPAELSDRVARYEAQTMLAIASKPVGNEFWQLMRSIANGVKDDRGTPRGVNSHKLEQIQDVLNFLAPSWLLYDDRKHVPSNGKWAWRTTKVHGIYNGGLPGLGKNA